jgi:hypothetical protein
MLVDLFDLIKIFLKRVDTYTKVPPSPVMTEIVVKIVAELLSAIALATKHTMQGRLSKPVFVDAPLASTRRREICKEAFEDEWRRGGTTKAR